MSIIIGFVVLLLASWIPSPMPIGMYWPIFLAALMSFACGVSGKFNALMFILGAIIGSVAWVVLNFQAWAQLSVMLAALQVLPTLAAAFGIGVGYVFNPIKEANT